MVKIAHEVPCYYYKNAIPPAILFLRHYVILLKKNAKDIIIKKG